MWLKGNLHTHTTCSRGDSPPVEVADWYRDHGYDFLSLTDHNRFVDPAEVPAPARGDMFLLPGEELTMELDVHVNAINIVEAIDVPLVRSPDTPQDSVTQRTAAQRSLLQAALDRIHQQRGLAIANHPNYHWGFDHRLMQQVRGLRFFEVFSGHPVVFNDGDESHCSTGQMWDDLLCAGARVLGVATDDAHHLKDWSPASANPGRGWVMVEAVARSPRAVQDSLERGAFYASTGVVLDELAIAPRQVELSVRTHEGLSHEVEFISDGRVVGRHAGPRAGCQLPAGARYLRAVVHASDGSRAWVQPVFGER